MRSWEATPCGRSVSDTRIFQIFVQSSLIWDSQSLPKRDGPEPSTTRSGTSALWSWYFRCAISCPCTLGGCPVYASRRVLDGMRGVSLKCFFYVSSEITETPAPASNSIRREVPFSSTGISIPCWPELRLYSEREKGSTESSGGLV